MSGVLDLIHRARRWRGPTGDPRDAAAPHAGVPGAPGAPAAPAQDDGAARNGYQRDLVAHYDRESIIAEQYRAIRTQIIARARLRKLQTHVLTSSVPEEGKTVTAANLGVAFSELKSQRTLLLEADLRRPRLSSLLRAAEGPGLVQLLRGEVGDLDAALRPTVYDNLQLLPAGGRVVPGSGELLAGPRMRELLGALKERYDHVLVDTPSVIAVNDACVLGAMCDETLLVVRLHSTPIEVVERGKQALAAAGCDLAGVILTHMSAEPANLYR